MSRTHPPEILPLKVVAASGAEIVTGTAVPRAARALGDELRARGFEVVTGAPRPRDPRVDMGDGEDYAYFLKQ